MIFMNTRKYLLEILDPRTIVVTEKACVMDILGVAFGGFCIGVFTGLVVLDHFQSKDARKTVEPNFMNMTQEYLKKKAKEARDEASSNENVFDMR